VGVVEKFKSVERQLNAEAERVKTEVDRDADLLRRSVSVDKALQAQLIDTAVNTLRQHVTRLSNTLALCQVHAQ